MNFFQILVKDKLRVISINANFCNNFNFWLLLNFKDPHKHLHWLYRQLHKAEIKKERVFILGHIAPGTHSCLGKYQSDPQYQDSYYVNSKFLSQDAGPMNIIVQYNDLKIQFLLNILDIHILMSFKYFSINLKLLTLHIWLRQKLLQMV